MARKWHGMRVLCAGHGCARVGRVPPHLLVACACAWHAYGTRMAWHAHAALYRARVGCVPPTPRPRARPARRRLASRSPASARASPP
eukprot:scaffold27718_cov64-Phaeocystis_antarctica.AAC.1